MAQIFVSYSRKDIDIVDQIISRLICLGFDIWMDRTSIKGGSLWKAEIVEAIDNAQAFVLMLSPHSVVSENVRKEIDLAESASCKLFPVRLADVALPPQLRYQLAGIQWIDYGNDPEGKFKELVAVLRDYMLNAPNSKKEEPTKQAEIIIGGVDLEMFGQKEQEKLLNYLAEITATPRGDLSLVKLSAGSVHAFIRMPAQSAYRLKAAALNWDRRLIQEGIIALRLDGDRDFVQIGRPFSGMINSSTWLIENSELSQTQIDVLQLHGKGLTSEEIARTLQIDVDVAVARRLEATQLIKHAELSQTQIRILQLDREGFTSKEIARALQIDVDVVYARRSEAVRRLAQAARHFLKGAK